MKSQVGRPGAGMGHGASLHLLSVCLSQLMRQMSGRPKEALLRVDDWACQYNWHLMCQTTWMRWLTFITLNNALLPLLARSPSPRITSCLVETIMPLVFKGTVSSPPFDRVLCSVVEGKLQGEQVICSAVRSSCLRPRLSVCLSHSSLGRERGPFLC